MNEETEKKGFLAKRSNKLLVLIIVAFLLLAAATVGAMEYTSTTGFCNSCHIMNTAYSAWESSSHKGVHCYECHMDDGTINYLKAKVNGLKEVYLTVTESVTTTGTDEKAWDKCQKCHAKVLEQPAQESAGFSHYKHIGKGLNCKQCHGNLIHGEATKDLKQTCVNCHKNGSAKPATHSAAEFKVNHGQAFLKDSNACQMCHSEGQAKQICQACHGVTMPHGEKFVDKHVTEVKAAGGAAACVRCHLDKPDNLPRKAQSCQTCHGIEMPHPQGFTANHGKTVKEQGGDKTCLNCHKDDNAGQNRLAKSCKTCHSVDLPHAKDFLVKHPEAVAAKGEKACVTCHSSSSTTKAVACQKCHGVPMPHPAGYQTKHTAVVASQGSKVCLNCHKDDNLARKAVTCVSCHGLPMPHPKDFQMTHMTEAGTKGALCKKCHTAADFKKPTCSGCHPS